MGRSGMTQKRRLSRARLCPRVCVDNYQIIRILETSATCISYLALAKHLSAEVILRENMPVACACREPRSHRVVPLPGRETAYGQALEGFLEDARKLAALRHPNVAPLLHAFSAMGTAYYAQLKAGGQTLLQRPLPRFRPKRIREVVHLLKSCLGALGDWHGAQMLHLGIRPECIWVTPEGEPQISAPACLGKFGSLGAYAPPEAFQEGGEVGPWSDIYSLGATFYACLTGLEPPSGLERAGRAADPCQPLGAQRTLRRRYTARVLEGIDKAMATDPTRRWQTAAEWAKALEEPIPRFLGAPAYICLAGAAAACGLAAVFLAQRGEASRAERQGKESMAPPQPGNAPEALYKMGLMLEAGHGGYKRQPEEAVKRYARAAEAGLAEAQYRLGLCYARGIGIGKDEAAALRWMGLAAEQEDEAALLYLATCCENGTGGMGNDKAKAAGFLARAAEQGNAEAQARFAAYCLDGQGGVKKDEAKAVALLMQAAKQGYAPA